MHCDSVGMYMHDSHGQKPVFGLLFSLRHEEKPDNNTQHSHPLYLPLFLQTLGLQCHWPLFLGTRCAREYWPKHHSYPKKRANIYNKISNFEGTRANTSGVYFSIVFVQLKI
jgi:hypothetical protein